MDEHDAALGRAVRRLLEIAFQDDELRAGLTALGQVVGELADAQFAEPHAGTHDLGSDVPAVPPTEPGRDEDLPEGSQPLDRDGIAALLARASLGGEGVDGPLATALRKAARLPEPTPEAPAAVVDDGSPDAAHAAEAVVDPKERDVVLAGIAERARAKATVTRAVARGTEHDVPIDDALVHRARSVGAALWMLDMREADLEALRSLAAAYEALGDAADLVRLLRAEQPADPQRISTAIRSLAAVQSALRVAAGALRPGSEDDQLAAFEWLRETTAKERIFIERHMRLDDPLDPSEIEAIAGAIRSELSALQETDSRREARERGLKKVRYHADRIARGRGTDHDKGKVAAAVDELVGSGVPPSNLELRAILLPVLDQLPEATETIGAYGRVLADLNLERERARRASTEPRTRMKPRSEDVIRTASLLSGREVVLIGGERRVEAHKALMEAFDLAGLAWYTLSEDPTLDELERAIARPSVAIVIQLIRWSRHRHGDAREIAEKHGKPFVRVPAGYNENAIAKAILEQASERLERRAP